jgi:hypothetical protein
VTIAIAAANRMRIVYVSILSGDGRSRFAAFGPGSRGR